ncbi:hypothetical protein CM15mP37_08750 [bacterium]|nr:MAG: hypothetical protein CM15mP37_08750 [bacterium]
MSFQDLWKIKFWLSLFPVRVEILNVSFKALFVKILKKGFQNNAKSS